MSRTLLCCVILSRFCFFFFFNDTATTEIYTLSLHDALPICCCNWRLRNWLNSTSRSGSWLILSNWRWSRNRRGRSEEHTSELQSLTNLVCRLLLEKKKNKKRKIINIKHNN